MAVTLNASTSSGLVQSADTSGNLNLQSNGTTVVAVTSTGASVTGLLAGSTNYTGFKNRIINGAMVIDQRNAGASKTITDTGAITYTLDRWAAYGNIASKFSVQHNAGAVTPPAGFKNYLGVTSLSAYSVTTSDGFTIRQSIEGFNTADLGWGTANASTVTLSFWVYSSLTGTFGGVARNSAANRSYPFTYTISAPNTWEQKTITIAGDTTGTWIGATNGIGLTVLFGLGVGTTNSGTAGAWASAAYESATGATSVVGTNGATFYITGVQLEKGSTATSFDYRPYGTELALCQRYLPAFSFTSTGTLCSGTVYNTTTAFCFMPFPVAARVAPTGIITPTASTSYILYAATAFTPSALTFVTGLPLSAEVAFTLSGGTPGQSAFVRTQTVGTLLFTGCEL